MFQKREMNMTEGPIFRNIVRFAIPLILTGMLQLLYNAADIIVVGKFAGKEALAAVGATGSLINLMVNFFISLSMGTGVLVARNFGAKDYEKTSSALHTSVALSLVAGIISMLIGLLTSKGALHLMGTPSDIIDASALYMKIYFIGIPATVFYNFCAMAMRSVGNTKGPLVFLSISGIVNVMLNLFLVIGFDMGVAGVAIATAVSQYVAAVMIFISLVNDGGFCHLDIKKIKIHKDELIEIIRIGIPAGIQSAVFSISNVIIQSSVNSFNSSSIVAGNSAGNNIEAFIYTAMYSMNTTAVTIVSQNLGARRFERIGKCVAGCIAGVCIIYAIMASVVMLMPGRFMSIYSSDTEVINAGIIRLSIVVTTYFTCGIMDTLVGAIRGLGSSFLPMCVSIAGVCGIRIVWVYTVFAKLHTLESLYFSYPITWVITGIVHFICFIIYKKKITAKFQPAKSDA